MVEDETKMARAIRRGLESEGYAVETVATGDDGVFWATEQEFDAVVLDVMLPGRDGFSVCRALRAAHVWTPVLMLTARGGVEDRIQGLDAGADDYLVKPFAFGELLARLRALLRRGPAERAPQLIVGDLVVDPAAHTVTRRGVAVDLSPREFSLLEYLARRSGEVVRRERDPRPRVGVRLRRHVERGGRLRRLPAQEAREAVRFPRHPRGAWGRATCWRPKG